MDNLSPDTIDESTKFFIGAESHEDLRDATFESAEFLLQSYFGSRGPNTIVHHGPLDSVLKVGKQDISAEDTCFWMVKGTTLGQAEAFMLAINAEAGEPIFRAAVPRLKEAMKSKNRSSDTSFGIIMVRTKISFFQLGV